MIPITLTIAGSDPSGGAGLQADLKTFHHFGVFGTSAVTLLTVQNTQQVSDVRPLDVEFVLAQLDAVIDDVPPIAAKTGALGTAELISAIANRARSFAFPLVVDPVMVSKHGDKLIDDDAIESLCGELLPVADWVTPNRDEASRMSGIAVTGINSMIEASRIIGDMGVKNVLIKGGAVDGQSLDLLRCGDQVHTLRGPWIDTPNTHGTGCVLSAAITANLALGRTDLQAAKNAKAFVANALTGGVKLGKGIGPVNFFHVRD